MFRVETTRNRLQKTFVNRRFYPDEPLAPAHRLPYTRERCKTRLADLWPLNASGLLQVISKGRTATRSVVTDQHPRGVTFDARSKPLGVTLYYYSAQFTALQGCCPIRLAQDEIALREVVVFNRTKLEKIDVSDAEAPVRSTRP